MSLWERWKKSQASAARWDDPAPGDVRTFYLKRLLRAAPGVRGAPEESARADTLLWQRLRRQLKPLGEMAPAAPPLFTALASMGPRFAVAAAAVLMLSLGLYTLPDEPPPARPAIQVAQATLLESSAPLFAEALETRSGDDLLAFIAYDTNR